MTCHTPALNTPLQPGRRCIALIGHPNVGKSALFQKLTGQRATVSNYPGTTIEVARAALVSLPDCELVDTPGVITLPAHSEDERVTARVLLNEPLGTILQVGDAKNLRRTLLLSLQLAELGLPLVLALNMNDEALARGLHIDAAELSRRLQVPVVPTTAIRGQGVPELLAALSEAPAPEPLVAYPPALEQAVVEIAAQLPETPLSATGLARQWLGGDPVVDDYLLLRLPPERYAALQTCRAALQGAMPAPISQVIQDARRAAASQLATAVLHTLEIPAHPIHGLGERLSRLTTHPVWGFGVLALVLLALYEFVGVFGAGTLVDGLESRLFGELVNPWVSAWVTRLAPWPWLADFITGEYGLWSMGMTYALALILPIVTTFFLTFGVMEDSGYLPRLAALSNRTFQKLGLNGKAVLPMVLGLGCVTMATMTARVLESKRERMLVTLLLALAIPCSAQLGVVMGMLAGISLTATLIWSSIVLGTLLIVGWLAARVLPGERTPLLVELPPLRWPQPSNVLLKTLARLEWYIKEVVPLFLVGTALMFTLDKLGWLAALTRAGEPLVGGWLGLPPEASAAFLMGFLRRDFGATGLFVMQAQGLLNPAQVVVAMTTITLFIPCLASLLVIAKERGWRAAAGMMALIFPLALLVGGLLQRALALAGWGG